MKALIKGGLGVVLGLAASRGLAQELSWRPAGNSPAFERVAPPVTLSRPVPMGATADSVIAPATLLDRPMPIFRAKHLDPDDIPQLMPVGPAANQSVQPGTAKPMTSLVEPRTVAPADSVVPTARFARARSMPIFTGTQEFAAPMPQPAPDITECGSATGCVESCVPCCPDLCRPFWGSRIRGWAGCCDDPCCTPRPRAWIRGEYLLWGISDPSVPDLLTGELAPIRAPDAAGVLPLSPVLFGEEEAGESIRNGGRIALGFWFPRRCNWGLDASFFILGRRNLHGEASSDALGNPVLARPYFQPDFGGVAAGEAAQLVSYPGVLSGKIAYDSSVRLWGVDAHLRRKLHCGPRYFLDGFVGYRHVNLADTIDINEDFTNLQFTPGVDTRRFVVNDHFATRNSFNGAQVGMEGELRLFRRWFVGATTKLAVGNVHQVINIDGSTTFVDSPVGTVTGRGGLLALVSNIGRYERNEFAVVPEFGIKLGFDVTDHLRVYAGYNVLFISSVVRAGEQIDRNVNFVGMAPEPGNLNPAVVNPARPAVLFRQSDFWAQGGQFGVEYHW